MSIVAFVIVTLGCQPIGQRRASRGDLFSTADQKVVRKQRQKRIEQIQNDLEKTKSNVARGGPHSDKVSVTRRVNRIFGNEEAAKYFSWEMVALTKKEQQKLLIAGRRGKRPTHRFEFTFDEQMMQEDEGYDGYSALVTTVPANQMSADQVFTKFKQQTYSERVIRDFKGPLLVRPVFLHSPRRVEALVFLLIAVLMLYYLLQRIYGQTVSGC